MDPHVTVVGLKESPNEKDASCMSLSLTISSTATPNVDHGSNSSNHRRQRGNSKTLHSASLKHNTSKQAKEEIKKTKTKTAE
ncbi:hypothetical protein PIB30_057446 [Stylosanthes scabra]|uniref:Uncharacterized protein n=1 Tax=Stylosanthes scabra TaxID=79078 RepID=A0ABU6WLM1_9FABA|nr:hypothetical protein [Stylosanthes scabra]